MTTKKCASCHAEKGKGEFYVFIKNKDGLCSYCKACVRNKTKNHYEANKEELLKYAKTYVKENKEKVKGNHLKAYQADRSKYISYSKKSSLKVNYSLSVEAYEQMYRDQNGVCLICAKNKS